jgi:hypothetical protein
MWYTDHSLPVTPAVVGGMISFRIMQPQSRRTLTIGWTAGAAHRRQIVALAIPPATTGSQRVILIGPAAVVLAALPVDFLILWLLIRRNNVTDAPARGKSNGLGRLVEMATTGLLGSFLTIIAFRISVNLTIAQIARFSN